MAPPGLEELSETYGDFYVPRFTLSVGGEELTEATGVVSGLSVETKLNAAATFSFTLTPRFNQESGEFERYVAKEGTIWTLGSTLWTFEPLVLQETLKTGTTVTIEMGYGDEQVTLLNGAISEIQTNFPASGSPTITVKGYDTLHRLAGHHVEKNSWGSDEKHVTIKDVVEELAATGEFTSVVVESSDESTNGDPVMTPHPKIERNPNEGDLTLLRRLAGDIGYELFVSPVDGGDGFTFRPANPKNQQPVAVVRYGETLRSFSPAVNGAGQVASVRVVNYDGENRELIEGTASNPGDNPHLGEAQGTEIINRSVSSTEEANAIAGARMSQRRGDAAGGRGETLGLPEIRAGETITLEGLGPHYSTDEPGSGYSGEYYIQRASHRIDTSGYTTGFTVKRAGEGGTESGGEGDERTDARRRTQNGVAVGLVSDNEDPEGFGRVRVSLPFLGEDGVSTWAPVAVPMAGDDMGTYFLPEVDDEVLVAFENGDLSYPYVVGSLWNADQAPPAENEGGTNDIRVIRSRVGHEVRFDDGDEPSLEISTGGGNHVTLSDASGSEMVTVSDSGGSNTIVIDATSGEVTITGATKVALSASMLELNADGNVDINAGGLLTLNGTTVNIN